jgi:predicted Zn-dependent protease with MMP-like domain
VHADKRLWFRLQQAADEEVRGLLGALPSHLREQVRQLPVVFEPCPGPDLVEDGLDSDLLGLFVGDAFDEAGNDPVPAEIILFLENLWEEAGHDTAEYRRQVRTTLLHEIGHYLGLEEDDLVLRDLE